MSKRYLKQILFVIFLIIFFLFLNDDAYSLTINYGNVQSIAIYGETSGFGIGLQPEQIVFNVTDPDLIVPLIYCINFSVKRDCSGLGSRTDAHVYIKFKDGSVKIYEVFGLWSHISKEGMRGNCYFISWCAQDLYEILAQ